jgi:hypothetical protein
MKTETLHRKKQRVSFMVLHLLRFWLSAEWLAESTLAEAAKQLHAREFKSASYSDHNANALSGKDLGGRWVPD